MLHRFDLLQNKRKEKCGHCAAGFFLLAEKWISEAHLSFIIQSGFIFTQVGFSL